MIIGVVWVVVDVVCVWVEYVNVCGVRLIFELDVVVGVCGDFVI